jgi:hypothetical protein
LWLWLSQIVVLGMGSLTDGGFNLERGGEDTMRLTLRIKVAPRGFAEDFPELHLCFLLCTYPQPTFDVSLKRKAASRIYDPQFQAEDLITAFLVSPNPSMS